MGLFKKKKHIVATSLSYPSVYKNYENPVKTATIDAVLSGGGIPDTVLNYITHADYMKVKAAYKTSNKPGKVLKAPKITFLKIPSDASVIPLVRTYLQQHYNTNVTIIDIKIGILDYSAYYYEYLTTIYGYDFLSNKIVVSREEEDSEVFLESGRLYLSDIYLDSYTDEASTDEYPMAPDFDTGPMPNRNPNRTRIMPYMRTSERYSYVETRWYQYQKEIEEVTEYYSRSSTNDDWNLDDTVTTMIQEYESYIPDSDWSVEVAAVSQGTTTTTANEIIESDELSKTITWQEITEYETILKHKIIFSDFEFYVDPNDVITDDNMVRDTSQSAIDQGYINESNLSGDDPEYISVLWQDTQGNTRITSFDINDPLNPLDLTGVLNTGANNHHSVPIVYIRNEANNIYKNVNPSDSKHALYKDLTKLTKKMGMGSYDKFAEDIIEALEGNLGDLRNIYFMRACNFYQLSPAVATYFFLYLHYLVSIYGMGRGFDIGQSDGFSSISFAMKGVYILENKSTTETKRKATAMKGVFKVTKTSEQNALGEFKHEIHFATLTKTMSTQGFFMKAIVTVGLGAAVGTFYSSQDLSGDTFEGIFITYSEPKLNRMQRAIIKGASIYFKVVGDRWSSVGSHFTGDLDLDTDASVGLFLPIDLDFIKTMIVKGNLSLVKKNELLALSSVFVFDTYKVVKVLRGWIKWAGYVIAVIIAVASVGTQAHISAYIIAIVEALIIGYAISVIIDLAARVLVKLGVSADIVFVIVIVAMMITGRFSGSCLEILKNVNLALSIRNQTEGRALEQYAKRTMSEIDKINKELETIKDLEEELGLNKDNMAVRRLISSLVTNGSFLPGETPFEFMQRTTKVSVASESLEYVYSYVALQKMAPTARKILDDMIVQPAKEADEDILAI